MSACDRKPSPGRKKSLERKTVQTAVWLFEDQREKLKRTARGKGITPSALMRDLIDQLTEDSEAIRAALQNPTNHRDILVEEGNKMAKNTYTAWAQNSSGASTSVPGSFTSIREAENAARREFAGGWTIHIIKRWIDGDGQSWNNDYDQEVKSFTIR